MKGVYKQGIFTITNRSKYIGSKDPAFKSGLEERVMNYMDKNSSVLKWAYEDPKMVVEYFLPTDGRIHRYYPDFYMEAIGSSGTIKKFLIEVKTLKEIPEDYLKEMYGSKLEDKEFKRNLLKEPKSKLSKSKENYNRKRLTVLQNKAKFDAAKDFCKKNGMTFKVITQNEISKLF